MGPQRVLIVCTSHDRLGSTGKATGLWLEELAVPYWVLRDAGYEVDVVSMAGGRVPLDPRSTDESDRPAAVERFLADRTAADAIASTRRLADIAPDAYAAIFLPGGHGAMWDFAADEQLARAVAAAYDDGRIVAAVCHGPAGLVGAVRADGKALVGARRVTSFTNHEEAEVGLTDAVPFLLESRLRELGAIFECAHAFSPYVVRDGNLVTGQNPQSSRAVAEAVVAVLAEHRPHDSASAAREAGLSVRADMRPGPASQASRR